MSHLKRPYALNMKPTPYILFLLTFLTTLRTVGQPATDCGCSAALRYDVYKSKHDFYSEMLLARDITKDNYKEIQQEAGVDLSIFGIGIGADGENIEKIKEAYREHLYNRNVQTGMTQYESITTSNVSYSTYQACMKLCLGNTAQAVGIGAYIISEDASSIYIDLHYKAAQGAPVLPITYSYGNNVHRTVRLTPNTWANPVIRIPRISKDGFPVVFSPGGQYDAKVVAVPAYKPLTANLDISYILTRDEPGQPISYTTGTEDNSRGEKGNGFELMLASQLDAAAKQAILSMPDGAVAYGHSSGIYSNQGYWATRIGFKATAPSGYLLRNPRVICNSGPCDSWVDDAGYVRNDENVIIYTAKHYSSRCVRSFTVDTHRLVHSNERLGAFSTNAAISFSLPPGSAEGIMRYTGGSLPLGQSNSFLHLANPPITSADGYITYDYTIATPATPQPGRQNPARAQIIRR